MEKLETNTSKEAQRFVLRNRVRAHRFVVNQVLDGSNPADPNLKRQVTIVPENTGDRSVLESLTIRM